MRLIWHPEAQEELAEAGFYYERQVKDLGPRFVAEVESAVARILSTPSMPRIFRAGCRRVIVERFPYSVIYRVKGDAIQIFAIAHGKRRPGYWRNRLDS
jgi:plasmid stabilization system protein ParE